LRASCSVRRGSSERNFTRFKCLCFRVRMFVYVRKFYMPVSVHVCTSSVLSCTTHAPHTYSKRNSMHRIVLLSYFFLFFFCPLLCYRRIKMICRISCLTHIRTQITYQ
jgi:hypothetical protein